MTKPGIAGGKPKGQEKVWFKESDENNHKEGKR